eukprot:gene10891-7248_t
MPAVCHNYMAGRCRKSADDCFYRHPEACIQFSKGKCSKRQSCRFAHVGKPAFEKPPRVQPYHDPKPKDPKPKSRAERLEEEINLKQKQLEAIRRKEEEKQAKLDAEKQRKEELKEAQAILGDAIEAFKDVGGLPEDVIEPLKDLYSEQAIAKAFAPFVKKHSPGPGLDLSCTRRRAQHTPAGRSGRPPPVRTGNLTPTYSQRRPPPGHRADGPSAHEQTASLDAPPKHRMRSTREWNKLMHATN